MYLTSSFRAHYRWPSGINCPPTYCCCWSSILHQEESPACFRDCSLVCDFGCMSACLFHWLSKYVSASELIMLVPFVTPDQVGNGWKGSGRDCSLPCQVLASGTLATPRVASIIYSVIIVHLLGSPWKLHEGSLEVVVDLFPWKRMLISRLQPSPVFRWISLSLAC